MSETNKTIDRSAIDLLSRLQKRTGLSDDKFAKRYLRKSGTTWLRIKSGDYFETVSAKATKKHLTELALAAKNAQRTISISAKRQTSKFIKFEHIESVGTNIEECIAKPLSDPDRLITFLAPTGGGKSALSYYLRDEYDATVVEARESWMRSYFCACCDIVDAMGLDRSRCWTPAQLEDLMVNELNERDTQVLVIDEGEFFGPQAANLLKLLLNKTPTVIVVLAIPKAFHRWMEKNSHQSQQLRRRTHNVIEFDQLAPKEVETILNGNWPAKERQQMAIKIAKAANTFGLMDTCFRVVNQLLESPDQDVSDLINDAKKAMSVKG